MTGDEEFEDFVRKNRDLIERMIELQKGSVHDFADAEKAIAVEAYSQARDAADRGRVRTEDALRAAISTITDPEVQRHFMNMGLEFFMGMSALMQRAPMPDAVREGISSTELNMRDAACRSNDGCAARSAPKKVDINIADDAPRRKVADDVFKSVGE